MKFIDKIRFVRQNMKKNRMRVFMTVLATAIGCAFLIMLASVGFGLQKSIITDLTEGKVLNEIYIHGKEDQSTENKSFMNDEDIEYFESIDDVKAVTRLQYLHYSQEAVVSIEDYKIQPRVAVSYFPAEVEMGMELSEGRLPSTDNEILVGYNFKEYLEKPSEDTNEPKVSYEEELIGQNLQLKIRKFDQTGNIEYKTIPLKVVGIKEKLANEFDKDTNITISDALFQQIEEFTQTKKGEVLFQEIEYEEDYLVGVQLNGERLYDRVSVYTQNVEQVKGVSEEIREKGYINTSVTDQIQEINALFLVMKIGLIFVGTIALIIASIGIFNTMTMAVTERSSDIGIMKAIGAHPSTIRQIFLIESSYIGILGALIGTVSAFVLSKAVNLGLPFLIETMSEETSPEGLMFSYIPLSLVVISASISILVAVFSGWRPAKKATSVDVLKAMRRDI
ncbi:ABC transporter permease [Chengkuizengella sediminis]|uniref:ABC transporter permease n=1 Tax=Chengkuizengella sediminis TaxID=1885917 RepID=UPI001389ABCA|nr:ABC transporter permease [Chengkuizengella sediminis]NDI35555.1 ABC transporter permease [Chengkuizengella sediminis]